MNDTNRKRKRNQRKTITNKKITNGRQNGTVHILHQLSIKCLLCYYTANCNINTQGEWGSQWHQTLVGWGRRGWYRKSWWGESRDRKAKFSKVYWPPNGRRGLKILLLYIRSLVLLTMADCINIIIIITKSKSSYSSSVKSCSRNVVSIISNI